jgi:predicted ATPase
MVTITKLGRREMASGTWDDEHVKALLHFPRFPIHLIQQEPWQTWIGQRGGLKAVYAYLQGYPLSPSHRRILDVVLSNPESVANVYADRLNISRATYFYQLRELVPALVQALNHWELDRPAPLPPFPDTISSIQPTLPTPLTNLVGAESLLQSLTRLLLRDDVRLLTLLGPGGIGKTRLAIELSHRLSEGFSDQLCFVDLSTLRDYTQVASTITQTLGLKESGDSQLKAYLRPRDFLLVLDNFEHILPARSLVTELLATAPRVKILVTSRAALHIYGEHEFVVPPMATPSIENAKDAELLAQSPAVMLFVQRAQEVNPSFALNNENSEAVFELCRRMEGIPLAIELAAFQIKYFSPQAMLVRLSNARRLAFLSQVPKRLPAHQQTMRDMLDWSYTLLSPDLQTLFSRLAVFPGGCTIEAAESVCAIPYSDQDGNILDIQNGLTALVDQSLLSQHVEADGEPRFHMLGISREYAFEQLETRRESGALHRAHALYYLNLAEQFASPQSARGRAEVFALLQHEYTNLKSAIHWVLEQREGELGLRFIVALWDYWKFFGNQHEGRQFAQTVLEQTGDLHMPIRAHVLRLVGWLAHDICDYTTMLWAFQSSLELSEALVDLDEMGLALQGLGELARLRGQPEHAHEQIQQCYVLFNELQNQKQIAWSLDLLGRIELSQGKLPQAQVYFQESLDLFQTTGSDSDTTFALIHLGQTLFYQGLSEQAVPLFEKSLDLSRTIGITRSSICALAFNYLGEIAILHSQPQLAREMIDQSLFLSKNGGYRWCIELGCFTSGLLAMQDGEIESAAFYFRESLLLQQSLKEHWRSIRLLEAAAALSLARHELLGAARLYGAAECLRVSLSIPQMPVYYSQYEDSLVKLKEQLDAPALDEAWGAGQELSLEQAVMYALRCLE